MEKTHKQTRERFLAGDWEALWKEAKSAEYTTKSSHLTCHQLEELAKERGNHGDIKGAITALQAGHTSSKRGSLHQGTMA